MKALTSLIALTITFSPVVAADSSAGFESVTVSAPYTSTEAAMVALEPGTLGGETEATPDPFGIYGADADTETLIHDSMATFTEAGLELPELRIYVHDTNEPCNGHYGVYNKGSDRHRVDICNAARPVIIHELAHAWENHSVDDVTREAFMAAIGTDIWHDHDAPHRMRAIEQVAYLLVWGLDSRPIPRVHPAGEAENIANYELLTGQPTQRIAGWSDAASTATAPRLAVDVAAEPNFG